MSDWHWVAGDKEEVCAKASGTCWRALTEELEELKLPDNLQDSATAVFAVIHAYDFDRLFLFVESLRSTVSVF